MRNGVRLALDIGSRRIGVARCDRDGIMAVPVATVDATAPDWATQVRRLVEEFEPIELVVGNPVSLRGRDELASATVRERVQELREVMPEAVIRLVDERLSTATAARQLREAGRDGRSSRAVIDAAAAVGILEFALECERRTGSAPGELA